MEQRKISRAVISRLPRYYRYLGDLLEAGVERISSNDLSKKMQVTASQIRQDLNNFGGFGQQGYGYNVKYLYTEIGKILGLDKDHNFIIIGAGNLGQALANYASFERNGFILKSLFIERSITTSVFHVRDYVRLKIEWQRYKNKYSDASIGIFICYKFASYRWQVHDNSGKNL